MGKLPLPETDNVQYELSEIGGARFNIPVIPAMNISDDFKQLYGPFGDTILDDAGCYECGWIGAYKVEKKNPVAVDKMQFKSSKFHVWSNRIHFLNYVSEQGINKFNKGIINYINEQQQKKNLK
jgi:hypothetical protein